MKCFTSSLFDRCWKTSCHCIWFLQQDRSNDLYIPYIYFSSEHKANTATCLLIDVSAPEISWGEGAELILVLRMWFCRALLRWWLSGSSRQCWWRAPSCGRNKSLHLCLSFIHCMKTIKEWVKFKDCHVFVCFQDINVCILENYPECSNPRVFYIIPYFCGQHPQCRYLQTVKLHTKAFW